MKLVQLQCYIKEEKNDNSELSLLSDPETLNETLKKEIDLKDLIQKLKVEIDIISP